MKVPVVTHTHLVAIAGVHSRDGTLALQRPGQRGLLIALDRRRPVTYGIPDGALTSRHLDLFGGVEESLAAGSGAGLQDKVATLQAGALTLIADTAIVQDNPASSQGHSVTLQAEPVTLNDTLPTLNDGAVTLQAEPATLNDALSILNEASPLVPVDRQSNSRRQRASDTERLAAAIVGACAAGWLTVDEIAVAVGRSVTYVRNAYLPKLVASGRLEQRFAGKARHRGQAYRAATQPGRRGTE